MDLALALASVLVPEPELGQVKALASEKDPASVWELELAKDPALGLVKAPASGLEPGLVPVKALASEKDPELGTDQGLGLAPASAMDQGLAPEWGSEPG